MFFIIFKKEMRSLFKSPLFYIMAFLTSLLLSAGFSLGLQNFLTIQSNAIYQFGIASSQLNIHYAVFLNHLSFLNLILIFFTPALSMRLMTEEKRQRSLDLLMTSPLRSSDIVLGKFLTLIAVIVIFLLLAMSYLFLTVPMVDFTWTPTLVAVLGIFLLGATYAALDLFAASLTENPMMALILGVVSNISLWIFGGLAEVTDQEFAKKILEHLSMNQHFQSIIEGVFKTSSFIYFLSIIFFFCFLCERLLESSRWRS